MTSPQPPFRRAIVIVMDSVGIGELPDASVYGDQGSNTVGNIHKRVPLKIPTLRKLGLDRLVDRSRIRKNRGERQERRDLLKRSLCDLCDLPGSFRTSLGAYGRMAEASAGKDSVTGHWEMMGIVLDRAFPTFPHGFAPEIIAEFSRATGRGVLGNKAASGTDIIDEFGPEHLRTGALIVYTSADSVFQIAAHEEVVPVPELYRACEIAYKLVGEGLGVGRVIARPFVGAPGAFKRTSNRHDYALPPSGETLLDRVKAASIPVVAIGKIEDLFAGRGITPRPPHRQRRGRHGPGRTPDGRAAIAGSSSRTWSTSTRSTAIATTSPATPPTSSASIARLAALLPTLRDDDLLVVTADHGNDPTTPSTDHAREYVPLLVAGPRVQAGRDLGTRRTFADLGQTLAEIFGVGRIAHGTSFMTEITT